MFYEPEADSQLMVECINNLVLNPKLALDVGVGSGILSQTVCTKWPNCEVVGIDINDAALSHSDQTIAGKFEARKSDLFAHVSEKFDLIVCNPPYLPQNKFDDMGDIVTRALVSGPKGYEYIERFLDGAHRHINEGGKILLLFSNLSNKEHIDFLLLSSIYAFKELVRKNVGMMENLYIYELWVPDVVYDLINPVFVSRGRRGMVIKGEQNGKVICAKIPFDETFSERITAKESTFLKLANKVGVGPNYISHTKTFVLMDFFPGTPWKTWVRSATPDEMRTVLAQVKTQCIALDSVNVTKQEMTNPVKHILVDKNLNVCLVDFERATITNRPKNVAQFEEFVRKVEKTYFAVETRKV